MHRGVENLRGVPASVSSVGGEARVARRVGKRLAPRGGRALR